MGESRLRLPLILFIGLVCGWLNVVGRFFGENHWRTEAVRASCTELGGLFPMEAWYLRHGLPEGLEMEVQERSIGECSREHPSMYVRRHQTTWAHARAIHDLEVSGEHWSKERLDPFAERARADHATIGQRVWHALFRLTSFASFGAVGPEQVLAWDTIATATLSCLLAMLLMSLALRRIAPARDPIAVV